MRLEHGLIHPLRLLRATLYSLVRSLVIGFSNLDDGNLSKFTLESLGGISPVVSIDQMTV